MRDSFSGVDERNGTGQVGVLLVLFLLNDFCVVFHPRSPSSSVCHCPENCALNIDHPNARK